MCVSGMVCFRSSVLRCMALVLAVDGDGSKDAGDVAGYRAGDGVTARDDGAEWVIWLVDFGLALHAWGISVVG
jgi:hypothetical protein